MRGISNKIRERVQQWEWTYSKSISLIIFEVSPNRALADYASPVINLGRSLAQTITTMNVKGEIFMDFMEKKRLGKNILKAMRV